MQIYVNLFHHYFNIIHISDFLPMKCDACEQIFCKDHFRYDIHKCEKSYLKNVQVPICPLCNQPVPTKRGEQPDIEVSLHIDRDCQSDGAKKKRNAIYSNKCSLAGCKQKEVVRITCSDCNRCFCLKHRHPVDHRCAPTNTVNKVANGVKSKPGASFLRRFEQREKSKSVPKEPSSFRAVQGNLTEDEALAKALQQSLQTSSSSAHKRVATSQEDEDRMLAEAIAASEREMRKNKDKCCIS